MQISGVSTSSSIPMDRTISTQAGKVSSDAAVLKFSADSFSSLVQEAGQMPEVRTDLVEAFRSRIQSGNYPTQETIAGLANLIGPSIVQQAKAGSSSK